MICSWIAYSVNFSCFHPDLEIVDPFLFDSIKFPSTYLLVEYYLFLLQSKAVFLNLVYFRRALSSQPAPYQVLMIKCTKTT